MNTMVLAIAGIVTAGGAAGFAFLGPSGEPATSCDSKPLEAEESTDYTLRMKVTNIDGQPDVRICVFTHDRVKKVHDEVIQVRPGTTRLVDLEMPSHFIFLQEYQVLYETPHGSASSGGVDDSCRSGVIEVELTYGADLIGSSSGTCVERSPSGGREATMDRRHVGA